MHRKPPSRPALAAVLLAALGLLLLPLVPAPGLAGEAEQEACGEACHGDCGDGATSPCPCDADEERCPPGCGDCHCCHASPLALAPLAAPSLVRVLRGPIRPAVVASDAPGSTLPPDRPPELSLR